DRRRAGPGVCVTVPDPAAAATAVSAGAACLCVQGAEAGAHRGTFTNAPGGTVGVVELIAAIRAVASVPLVAAGGIMDAGGGTTALAAGAAAVPCGAAFLPGPGSGAHPGDNAAHA